MMNINLWGRHMGCEAQCIEKGETFYGVVNAIRGKSIRILYTKGNDGRWFNISQCSPVCKDIRRITEHDAERLQMLDNWLEGNVSPDYMDIVKIYYDPDGIIQVDMRHITHRGRELEERQTVTARLSRHGIRFLESLGYYCGQYPEYEVVWEHEVENA